LAISHHPLAYCGNVHPAESLADLQRQLEKHALPIAGAIGRPLGVGLWLPRSAVRSADEPGINSLKNWLQERRLSVVTMNAFPFGDFHARRVKERVYLPDWADGERLEYTEQVAELLASLLTEGGEGSLSTLPCCYRRLTPNASAEHYFKNILRCVGRLKEIRSGQGKTIRLALEPEPGCFLERTEDAIRFIQQLREYAYSQSSEQGDAVRDHLGICFDVCHSAVMFESPADAIRSAAAAGIRIVKVQISSALELRDPKDRAARKFLSQFVEERYLHQTTALSDGKLLFAEDLTAPQVLMPDEEWKSCPTWRVHFHVPIHKTEIGPLHTTTWAVDDALEAVAALPEAPDLEVETYTWDVLPAISRTDANDTAMGLAAELNYAQAILDRLGG